MSERIEEILELLNDSKHSGDNVTLHGSGQFVNCKGSVVSPYDVLKSLQKKQDAIEQAECLVRSLKNIG